MAEMFLLYARRMKNGAEEIDIAPIREQDSHSPYRINSIDPKKIANAMIGKWNNNSSNMEYRFITLLEKCPHRFKAPTNPYSSFEQCNCCQGVFMRRLMETS